MSETDVESGFTVHLVRSDKRVFVPEGGSILYALLEQDVPVPYACGVGFCGACWQKVVGGTPEHRDFCLTDEQREEGAVMICCAGSRTAELSLDL